jgi:peroxiredoxin
MAAKRSGALVALISILFLLAASGCKRTSLPPTIGNPAPAFALKDLDGKVVRLSDLAGKIVVLDFWATWCGPCKQATEELESLHRKFRDRGVVVIGISVDKGGDAAEKVKEFAKRQGMTYLLLMDDGTAKTAYQANVIPATFVLDRQHIIRNTFPGFRPGIGGEIMTTIEKMP